MRSKADDERVHTVVMTELGPFLFYYLPVLLRDSRYRIERLFVSRASADRLEAFFAARWWRKLATIARAVRGARSLRPARCYLFLLRRRDLVSIFDEAAFAPVATDYLCSLGFLRRIPASQLDVSATSSNIHWSLLPRYAGCHPFYWVIRNGERESGVTIHQVAEGYDDGPILIQRRIPIGADETAVEFRARAVTASREEFAKYLREKPLFDRLARPQDRSHASFFSVPKPEEYRLRAGDGPDVIRAKFRAAGPGVCHVEADGERRSVVAVEGVGAAPPANARAIRLAGTEVYVKAA